MLQLNDHIDMRGPDSEIFKIIDEKARFLEENYLIPLKLYELQTGAVILQDTSVDIIHKIYGILDVNATELTEDIDAMVLYHTGSLLEHNCTPNTMQNIDEKNKFKITFRTASPIKKGEHITSIYTHILWGTSARRAHLKKTKYFDCNCARCQDPTEFGTYLSALRCIGGEKNPCGGMQLPVKPCEKNCTWVCDKCEIMLPDEDVMKFVDHLNEQVDKVLAEKTTMNNLEDTLTKLLNFLHPNHYLIYSIKHSLLQLYGNEGNIESSNTILQEKLKMCEHLTNLTKTIDPGNARLSLYLGVILHENVTCRLKLLQRMFDEANQQTLTDEIMNISDLMKENKEVLRFVTDTSAGAKLFFEVEKNELKLKNWIKENDIHL
ncbi:hypothetical protein JTB14_032237 [Gonioctena quinquepunctata]|nr:hypothetical protein JTB14_032237 [Gonioctena quinquepunctata]